MDLRDKKTLIKFYNGMRTIGGTYIEVSYENSRILFDFGSEFNPELKEEPKELQDILDAKLVPYIYGIFDDRIKLQGYENVDNVFDNTAVFLSHIHLDHSKMINYLDEKIPLYTSEKTKKLLDVVNINEDFLYKNQYMGDKKVRDIIGISNEEKVKIGEIEVQMIEVDHDAYGACGILIKTPDLKISYTGDIRMHGFRKEDTLNFCDKSKDSDILIIEGVSVSFRDFDDELLESESKNEQELIDRINRVINENPNKQITFNYYISNIERILKLNESVNRRLVLSNYCAYSIFKLTGQMFYFYKLENDKDYGLDDKYQISLEELLEDEQKYLWQFDKNLYHKIDDLIEGGIYIHTDAEPLGEFDPKYLPFVEMFKKRDIKFLRLTCSGHAFPKDLIKIIDLIKPRLLTPIHSQKPEKLYNIYGDVLLPIRNQII